jgi:hypothetical protein
MVDISDRLMEHVDAAFTPDWPEKAARLMEAGVSEIDRLNAEIRTLKCLLHEALVKFEGYRCDGFKSAPVNLMRRIEKAIQITDEISGAKPTSSKEHK